MPNGEVYWQEGMFLRQHHFLTEHRQLLNLIHAHQQWSLHHGWGLRSIELLTGALQNNRFEVTKLKARLRDGTTIEVPEDGPLPVLQLKESLEASRTVTIHLAVPSLRAGQPNVAEGGGSEERRYLLATPKLEDENRGVAPHPITLRKPNLKLLISAEPPKGYDSVPIAMVEKSNDAKATPQLAEAFIPPVLACDAWPGLSVNILKDIYDRVGRKIETLSEQVASRGLSFGNTAPEVVLILAQLRELNEAFATLTNLAFVEGIHPLPAYQELCRMVGQMAIFGQSRRTPVGLPRYDHDKLGECFHAVKNYLVDLLTIVPEPDYQVRVFVGLGLKMKVTMEEHWVKQNVPMFIAVRSPLDHDQCAALINLTHMKAGDPDHIDSYYGLGGEGLTFVRVQRDDLPPALPKDKDLTYFQIDTGQQNDAWHHVKESHSLAIRFNENTIVGGIDGLTRVILGPVAQIPVSFVLYVLNARGRAPV